MFSIKVTPGFMFEISLSLTSFDSSINASKFGKSLIKLFFSISKKSISINNCLVTNITSSSVHIHVIFIFRKKSVTYSSCLSMISFTNSQSIRAFIEKVVDQISDITKISLCGHVKRKLTENSLSKWVLVNLSKNIHVLFFS